MFNHPGDDQGDNLGDNLGDKQGGCQGGKVKAMLPASKCACIPYNNAWPLHRLSAFGGLFAPSAMLDTG